jgi:hypothetical protein
VVSGYIQGKEASDLELNYAAGLERRGLEYTYEYEVQTAYSLPHEKKKIDFMVWEAIGYPVEIDGDFAHKSAEQKAEDVERDGLINEALLPHGFAPVQRITEEHVLTPDAVDITIREQFP